MMLFRDVAAMCIAYTALAMCVFVLVCISGCGAACQTERAVVDALGVGMTAADVAVGDDASPEYERASMIAHGAQQLGSAAVDACELLRDGAGWKVWVESALESAFWVAGLIDGATPEDIDGPVPIELLRAIAMLEYEATR